MREYKVKVERDGRWWMIHVPEIDQITQARRINEIEDMARSLIAISTDQPISEITVHVANICVDGVDVLEGAAQVTRLRNRAVEVEQEAVATASDFAVRLTKADVPVRDIATLIHVSPQRVSQLTNG
ncbi:MAG TPA: HicB family toxin-antitoxin system [Mycobacterium sp.]|uniref:HicB family toxin-antitoxin system n=1 Tax=Mycobacterium sp. TaxID=1785 RepID=UPI002C30C5B8|nr:HicB family toxin-antitoxin system [Mycobacterium sp.]HME79550.1 HicB family toxin-antitoxin system [Mycobacterium sp.]